MMCVGGRSHHHPTITVTHRMLNIDTFLFGPPVRHGLFCISPSETSQPAVTTVKQGSTSTLEQTLTVEGGRFQGLVAQFCNPAAGRQLGK